MTGRLGRWGLVLTLMTAGVALVSLLAVGVGVESVPLREALTPGTLAHTIVLEVRLPRVVLGLLVGAALGVSGATLQAILRNPLADPYILGVSGGAALGGTLALSLAGFAAGLAAGGGPLASPAAAVAGLAEAFGGAPVFLAACAGAVGATLLTFAVARTGGRIHPHTLLLTGVVFNAFASAVILFLRTVVTQEKAQELLFWLVGALGYRGWSQIAGAAALILPGVLFLTAWSARLNLLAVGDAGAGVLGVDVERTRAVLVGAVSLVVGTAVSLAGLIGFVGLMVPHFLRMVLGADHRLLVPASALAGAAFLVASDLAARLSFLALGTEPPVGVVTAFLGGPFFLLLLRRRGATGAAA